MKEVSIDEVLIKELLTRAVGEIYPSQEALRQVLFSGRRIRLYLGIDPTGPHLHLGHLTNLLILKKFQKLGHEVILLIGDFTAQIGDPTGKLATRQLLTEKQVKQNLKTFKTQVARVLKFSGENPVKLKFNSVWLSKLNLASFLRLASLVTHQQLIERDMFQERIKSGKDIHLNELLYPLLQGYDSVAMGVDLEIGGTDQTFNMLMGRRLMKILKNKEKFVLTTKLLENPKTGRKLMNKSEGGLINLDDSPEEIFGKIMALDDASMFPVAEYCSEMNIQRLLLLKKEVAKGILNPRDAKLEIAEEVVKVIYGPEAAKLSREKFIKIFSKKDTLGVEIPFLKLKSSKASVLEIVLASKVVKSKSEARRLIKGGAFRINGQIENRFDKVLFLSGGETIRIGKHRFFRIKI